jgi:hypothetical protein
MLLRSRNRKSSCIRLSRALESEVALKKFEAVVEKDSMAYHCSLMQSVNLCIQRVLPRPVCYLKHHAQCLPVFKIMLQAQSSRQETRSGVAMAVMMTTSSLEHSVQCPQHLLPDRVILQVGHTYLEAGYTFTASKHCHCSRGLQASWLGWLHLARSPRGRCPRLSCEAVIELYCTQ